MLFIWGGVVLVTIFIVGWCFYKVTLGLLVGPRNCGKKRWAIVQITQLLSFAVVVYSVSVPFIVQPNAITGFPWPVHWGFAALLVLSAPWATLPLPFVGLGWGRPEAAELCFVLRDVWPADVGTCLICSPLVLVINLLILVIYLVCKVIYFVGLCCPCCRTPDECDEACDKDVKEFLPSVTIPYTNAKGLAAEAYLFTMDMLFRGDQYTDACSIAMAIVSQYELADIMIVVYSAGLIVQPLLSTCLASCCGGSDSRHLFFAVLGRHPMTMPVTDKAWAEIVRFVTESLPQPLLQIGLARHISAKYGQANYTVYASIIFSFLVALMAFVGATIHVASQVWDNTRFLREATVPQQENSEEA